MLNVKLLLNLIAGLTCFLNIYCGIPYFGDQICADISFCIVDFKFDGQNFKICEFGEGRRSAFKGMNRFYWDKYWNYLKQFNLPIWHVGGFYLPKEFDEMRAPESLIKCGGAILPSLEKLEQCSKFKTLVNDRHIENPYKISNYKAIICTSFMDDKVRKFKEKYPNILIWDLATAFYVNSKINTVELLNDDEFSRYSPKFKILNRLNSCNVSNYAQESAKEIIKEFKCDYYVIKPACGTMGRGVFIVSRNELAKTLKYTLRLYNSKKKSRNIDSRFKSWVDDKSKLCLVQEFVGSKIIQVDGKLYEPTMRLIFILCYDNCVPKIEILGGYWKIPNVSLDEKCDLTMKLKSGTSHETKAEIDPEDYQKVTKILQEFMPRLYLKMLGRPI